MSGSTSSIEGYHWGQTETILRSCNPQWTTTIPFEYAQGGSDGRLRFVVNVYHDEQGGNTAGPASETPPSRSRKSLGACLFRVDDILRSKNATKVKRLRGGGCIFCRIEHRQDHAYALQLHLGVSDVALPHSQRRMLVRDKVGQLFLEVSQFVPSSTHQPMWLTVYRSEHATKGDDDNGTKMEWTPFTISCNGVNDLNVLDTELRIQLLERRGNETSMVGLCETTIGHVMDRGGAADEGSPPPSLYLQRNSNKLKRAGQLVIQAARLMDATRDGLPADVAIGLPTSPEPSKDISHIDSFRQHMNEEGSRLSLSMAIDFTSSNGDPAQESSLHYQAGGSYSDYQEASLAVAEILLPYVKSTPPLLSMYGFGAKYGGEVRHCFQCGTELQVDGTDGIMAAYQNIFAGGLIMSGPKVFTHVIQACAIQSRKGHVDNADTGGMVYHVLAIVTNGCPKNVEETRRKLEAYQDMPLSIILVGLDGCDLTPITQGLNDCIASVIDFRSHQHESTSIENAVLDGVARQFMSYVRRINS